MKKQQNGASLLIVLVMLTVLAMAALSLARVSNGSTTVSGNGAFKAAAMQASEAGLSEAFAQLQALASAEDTTQVRWYYPAMQTLDPTGLPTGVNWSAAPTVTVPGGYAASYVVERMCTGAMPVTDTATQCFVKRLGASGSAKAGSQQMDSPAVVQYRLTAFVRGPKGTQTFVQALATRPA